jgi:hypothetical protein
MKTRWILAAGVAAVMLTATAASATPTYAVWLDGNTSPGGGGNGILTSLDHAFGAGSYDLVSTAQLETAGFLSSYRTVIVSRYDSSFGGTMSNAAAANIRNYVGTGASQGGVAVFTNDAADNFFGATTGDPFDANLDRLFTNAATFASASGHGYIGEFNGAVMAMNTNSAGFAAIGLLQGDATAVGGNGAQFIYNVGPIGAGNPIDAGITFPFTDSDNSTFLTRITGADPNNVVDVYCSGNGNGLPAVLANRVVIEGGGVPEPATWALMISGFGLAGAALRRRRTAVAA